MPRTAKTVRPATNRSRPVPAFGQLLQALRGASSVQEVVNALHGPKLKLQIDTNQGTVSGYEQGYNKKPDPVVLWGLASFYRVPVDGLIAVLHANRSDVRLTLDAAQRVLREHARGPRPEVAAAAIEAAERRLFDAAADLETIREGLLLETDEGPADPRR